MKVSIITICYNSEKHIHTAIESVLAQTYADIEYIVVDGKSTDKTLEIIQRYESAFGGRMKWKSEPDKGLYDAMNKGIRMASGEIIGLINSDDLFCDSDAITKIVKAFETKESLDAVYANLYYVEQDDISKIVRRWISGKQRPFKYGWHPAHPTLYVKKEVYDKYGIFNLDFKLAADHEIMLRFFEKYRISTIYIPDFFVKMRLGGTTNKNLKNIFQQNIECIKAFKHNGLSVNRILYPFFRIIPKLLQFKR